MIDINARAQEIVREKGYTIYEAELIAQAEAEKKKDFNKIKRTTLNSNCGWTGDIKVSLWENYGKKRVYFTDHKGRKCYLDITADGIKEVGVDSGFQLYVDWFQALYEI